MKQQKGYIFKASGAWYAKYREDVIENGVVIRKLRTIRLAEVSDRYRAEAHVRPLLNERLQPLNFATDSRANMRVGEFVETKYLTHIKAQKHVSTHKGYQEKWRNYLKGSVTNLWLRDVRTCDIQDALNRIARQHDLSKSTLRKVKALSSGIFNFARQQGFYDGANPVIGVEIPKARGAMETYACSLDEVNRMLMLLPEPARAVIATAAFAGLSRSELRGLEWQSYNGKELRVTQANVNGVVDEPKTRNRKAPVPVISQLRAILDLHWQASGCPASGAMFVNAAGKPLCMNNLANRVIIPTLNVCVRCGKPEHTHKKPNGHEYERDGSRPQWHGYHAFRRGLGTVLHDLGVNDKTIQAILRHSNVQVTQAYYIKTLSEQTIEAMQQLESAFHNCSKIPPQSIPARAAKRLM